MKTILLLTLAAASLGAQSELSIFPVKPVDLSWTKALTDSGALSGSSAATYGNLVVMSNDYKEMGRVDSQGVLTLKNGFTQEQFMLRLIEAMTINTRREYEYNQSDMQSCLSGWQRSIDALKAFGSPAKSVNKK